MLPTALVDRLGEPPRPTRRCRHRAHPPARQPRRAVARRPRAGACTAPSTSRWRSTSPSPARPASTPTAADPVLDALLGAGPDAWGVARRQHRPPGRRPRGPRLERARRRPRPPPGRRRSPTLDGQALERRARPPRPRLDALELDVVADGRHSLPTSLRLTVDDGGRPSTSPSPRSPARRADGSGSPTSRCRCRTRVTARTLAHRGRRRRRPLHHRLVHAAAVHPAGRARRDRAARCPGPTGRRRSTPAAGTTCSRSTASAVAVRDLRATPTDAATPAASP